MPQMMRPQIEPNVIPMTRNATPTSVTAAAIAPQRRFFLRQVQAAEHAREGRGKKRRPPCWNAEIKQAVSPSPDAASSGITMDIRYKFRAMTTAARVL